MNRRTKTPKTISLIASEIILWNALKSNRFQSVRFCRRHTIDKHTVDFYCPRFKLIIELDGELHLNSVKGMYDALREDRLYELGYTIIRLENAAILKSLDKVLEEITGHFFIPQTAVA
jgi:very-short-patch-repair endonuclease